MTLDIENVNWNSEVKYEDTARYHSGLQKNFGDISIIKDGHLRNGDVTNIDLNNILDDIDEV